jgi:hypothetical protein
MLDLVFIQAIASHLEGNRLDSDRNELWWLSIFEVYQLLSTNICEMQENRL